MAEFSSPATRRRICITAEDDQTHLYQLTFTCNGISHIASLQGTTIPLDVRFQSVSPDVRPVAIEVVPATHKSGRGPHSRVEASPVGYIIDTGARRFYFAGDTDLFDGMGELNDIDVALLPIWGWGPERPGRNQG